VDGMTLSQHWERHAKAWIAWSRSSPHDGFWDGTWPELRAVLPPPHGLVVDVGCGEGRLGRKLQPLGYDVVALDRSPTLLRAAFVANPTIPAVLADAAAVPLRDGRASLVVACMVLLDVDDLNATLREASRILTADGVICFAIVHPFSSAQDEDVWTHTTPVYGAPYLQDRRYELHIERH